MWSGLGQTRAYRFCCVQIKTVGYGKGESKKPDDYTWHHHQDSGYMQLIPTDIHAAIKHTGGIATGR
ncbi:HNH endonuclease [Erwinia pyrifoliae]